MTEQGERLTFGLKYEANKPMGGTFEIFERGLVLRIFCCRGRARKDNVFNHPEPSMLLPDCFSCLCPLAKHSRSSGSYFRQYAGTHKTIMFIVRARKEVASVQKVVACIAALASRRETTRGPSLSLEIVERKSKRAASHAVFSVTLTPFLALADILGCFSFCRIACCCATICC